MKKKTKLKDLFVDELSDGTWVNIWTDDADDEWVTVMIGPISYGFPVEMFKELADIFVLAKEKLDAH